MANVYVEGDWVRLTAAAYNKAGVNEGRKSAKVQSVQPHLEDGIIRLDRPLGGFKTWNPSDLAKA